MTLSLSLRRPKSPTTTEFSKRSKSFSKSRRIRSRSNTLTDELSSSTSSSTLNDAAFDLSIIVNSKQFDNFTSVKEVINKEKQVEEKKKEGGCKIKFQLNDIPNTEDKMSSRLIKGRKRFVTEETSGDNMKSEVLDLSKPELKHSQLLPSPLIRSRFPKSPYPFPSTESTLLPTSLTVPNSRDKKQSHRRSRSFSELITSSTSINQPWRDRETWLSIYTPTSAQTSGLNQRKGSIPSELENGGWRARGGGTFFGADNVMNGPYPSLKVRVKPLSPPTSPNRYFTSKREDNKSNENINTNGGCEPGQIYKQSSAIPTPDNSPKDDLDKIIYQHKSHSAWNVNTKTSIKSSLSDEDHTMITRYHTPSPEDDEDLLPPLLPRTITRASSFSSTSRNTTPIPWAQRSGTNSPGRQTPTVTTSPKTPSRKDKIDESNSTSSPLGISSTPKTWLQIDPSPPRSDSERKETSPLITPETPDTPTRSLSRALGGKKQPKRSNTPLTPSSPSKDFSFEDPMEDETKRSPSKRFWKALRLASPGKKEEKGFGNGRDSLDQGEPSPTKKSGWF